MAGGKGTRISSIANDIPKPLITIDGVPVLEREIFNLKSQGMTDIIITVSYLGDQIIDYFGDGSKYGVSIEYYFEKTPLGNAGALFRIMDKLSDTFLLINADSIFDVDIARFNAYHQKKGALATILTHPNNHPYDSGLIFANKGGKVTKWLAKEDERPVYYKNRVNAGLHILEKSLIEECSKNIDFENKKVDLDRDILKPLAQNGQLYCYDSPEYIRDMGTPERYKAVCEDYENGIVTAKCLLNKQKAIFLDRDGVINKYVGFLRNIDDFELEDGVAEAIRLINKKGYLAIVVTNQPVIARGEVTFEELDEIHNKMETLLGNEGAYLDAIYYCPHHPDKGFKGEVPELKIECECRKPKPGMLLNAGKDFNIDMKQSWMIGDGDNDVQAGLNAGCKAIKIGNECEYKNLLEVLNYIFSTI